MTKRSAIWGGLLVLVLATGAAQFPTKDITAVLKEIFPISSTTGNEDLLAERILTRLPPGSEVERDGHGGIIVRRGAEGPRLAILTALDGYGHIVGGITAEGYLTLDRSVSPPHPFFDGFLLGQPVVISTAGGPVHGVVAQPALHLMSRERRQTLVENFSLDNAFVDIGARSEKEARERGIEYLNAVTFWPNLTELAGMRWAGPSLGLKAACALLLSVAAEGRSYPARGEILFIWAAQTKASARGRGRRVSLGALRMKNRFSPQKVIILDAVAAEKGPGSPSLGKGPVLAVPGDTSFSLQESLQRLSEREGIAVQSLSNFQSPVSAPFLGGSAEVLTAGLPVQFANTPSEIIDHRDLEALKRLLMAYLERGGES